MSAPLAAASGTECAVDTERMLQLSPDAFDQDMFGGWRQLASRPGCETAAVDLIKAFIARNWARIGPDRLPLLYWHAGQLEAMAGNYQQAVPLLMAGVDPGKRRVEMGFHEYALGTIAFLDGDIAGLKAARQRLASTPEAPWYAAEFKAGKVTSWPFNLGVLDGLIRCFGSPYRVAYANGCPLTTPP